MRLPGFTAEAGIGGSATHYWGGPAHAAATGGGQLRPALVAPPICKTSGCVTVGSCRRRVRCCRSFTGACTCTLQPCFIFPTLAA